MEQAPPRLRPDHLGRKCEHAHEQDGPTGSGESIQHGLQAVPYEERAERPNADEEAD